MNKDIRIAVGMADHHKTVKLIRKCGEGAFRCLVRLWCYAAEHRPHGTLRGMDATDIAIASGWSGDELEWLESLVSTGWIDRADEELCLHDWEEHNPYAFHAEERSAKARNAAKVKWEKHNRVKGNAPSMIEDSREKKPSNAPSPSPSPSPSPTSSLRSDERPEGTLETQDEDLKARIFGPALQWLSERSGKPVAKLRSLVGKWCSQNGDGATLEAFQQAARASPVDPISWIEERLNGGKNGKTAETKSTGSDERVAEVAARLRRLKIGTYSDGDDQPVLPSV